MVSEVLFVNKLLCSEVHFTFYSENVPEETSDPRLILVWPGSDIQSQKLWEDITNYQKLYFILVLPDLSFSHYWNLYLPVCIYSLCFKDTALVDSMTIKQSHCSADHWLCLVKNFPFMCLWLCDAIGSKCGRIMATAIRKIHYSCDTILDFCYKKAVWQHQWKSCQLFSYGVYAWV